MDSHYKPKKLTLVTFLQSVYLSVLFTSRNDLFSYAAACAFGFLMSFVPVVMMTLVILLRVLRANPAPIIQLAGVSPLISSLVNIENLIQSIQQIRQVTNFEIILAIAIIWMARRFFISLVRSMKRIFNQTYRVQKGMTQALAFASESVLIILLSLLIFAIISIRTIVKLPLSTQLNMRYPELMDSFANLITTTVPFILIFIGTVIVYRFASRTKPTLLECLVPAGGCVFATWGFRKLMKLFINVNRYNSVYGVMSNVIVLLLEVYFFFLIFLFFAQYLFVNQFFDTLVLGELYVLPDHDDIKPKSILRRLLFIRPDSLLAAEPNVITLHSGESIYQQGDFSTDSFYLVKGTVQVTGTNSFNYITRGMFFGEESCMLEERRTEDAVAVSDAEIIRIPEELFFSLLEKNPTVAQKALSQISAYYSKFYGRNEDYSL